MGIFCSVPAVMPVMGKSIPCSFSVISRDIEAGLLHGSTLNLTPASVCQSPKNSAPLPGTGHSAVRHSTVCSSLTLSL